MSEQEWIEKLKSEGFSTVEPVEFEANQDLEKHTHDVKTIHIMISGEFTLFESDGDKFHQVGDYFETPAGTTHSGKAGPQGCRFIVAF